MDISDDDVDGFRRSLEGRDGGFIWTGHLEALKKFLSFLGYQGTWTELRGGRSHKFTASDGVVCTCYEPKSDKSTLLIQGKEHSKRKLEDKLRNTLDDPTFLADSKKANETVGNASKAEGLEECNEFNEDSIHDGLNPGKDIKELLKFKMKKWNKEGAKVTIATPFMDKSGLVFITSCLDNETVLDKVYTREVCAWDNKKIDLVIAEAKLPKRWIVKKVVAFKELPSFHAKFLAGEYKDKVELIVTSCNMTKEHLFSDQLETVMRTECPVKTFHSDYWLEPLEKMAKGKGKVVKFDMDDINQGVQKMKVGTHDGTSPCD